MAEHYRFFNSTEGDPRQYLASEFAEYFSTFLSDGLFSVNGNAGLKVTAGTGMQVNIDTGYAFIRGYMYKNDSSLLLTIDTADSMLDRIDRIVIRLDEIERTIHTIVKKGTPASSPQPPGLEVTTTVKELSLAQIRIPKGASSIIDAYITDERLTQYCGLVSSLITIPVNEMWNVWNGTLSQIQSVWETWFQSRQNELGLRVLGGSTEPTNYAPGDIWLKTL